ncbi:NADH:flavin oxidoreductase [Sporomusa termitida]|uniref:NADH oxidase n=1 Tax=Sporomusa termitida TaxID=2377 RepID=A0A517DV94_9FIRM|nr:NADH:flavin oxidoreductase [Sporomusa termitida]QDR81251.1 NADH oxidase [Sporomusa termitida]
MKSLFDQTELSGLTLKNRFIRPATYEGVADGHGHMTEALFQMYEDLAKGGVGTIITGATAVCELETLLPKQMGIFNDSFLDEYKKLTAMAHQYQANIIVQLVSPGFQKFLSAVPGKVIWVPSMLDEAGHNNVAAKAMTQEDIIVLQEAFAAAAFRAKAVGFDGVQIHAAHETLLSQFLTPYFNRRTDAYGGGIENRSRMIIETYQKIRAKVGPEYPVLIKINSEDFREQGLTFAECKYVCQKLAELGITAVEISGGGPSSRPNEGYARTIAKGQTPYFLKHTAEMKQLIRIPVIAVGGYRDIPAMMNFLNESNIDYFALCRPLICESDLINRWQSGNLEPAKCISCNGCHKIGASCVFKGNRKRRCSHHSFRDNSCISTDVGEFP